MGDTRNPKAYKKYLLLKKQNNNKNKMFCCFIHFLLKCIKVMNLFPHSVSNNNRKHIKHINIDCNVKVSSEIRSYLSIKWKKCVYNDLWVLILAVPIVHGHDNHAVKDEFCM